MSQTTAVAKPEKPAAISILNSETARIYSHIHPVIVLSSFLLQFRNTIADPVSSLLALLFPIAALQSLYAILCLPAKGAASTPKPSASKPGPRRKTATKVDNAVTPKISPALLSLTLSLTLGTPLLAAVLVLFGAPFTTHNQHTLLCAAHMALLTGAPLAYVHGVDAESWRAAAALMLPLDEVYGAVVGTLLGAWVGAVPIPLDWDREWQKWPVTIVTGAYLGWAVGKVVGGLLLRGRMIDLSP